MSNCRNLEPLFTPYVDGLTRPDERASIESHLAKCPPCRVRVTGERAAREVLGARRGSLRECASDRLRERCAAHQLKGAVLKGRWRAAGWRTVVPLSLAATLLLAVGGVFVYSTVNQVEALAASAAFDHWKCSHIESARGGDPEAAGAQWAARHGWAVRVPASQPATDLQFLTVRRCLITDGRTAHLMYTWRGQPLSVFVVPGGVDKLRATQVVETLGHEAVMWSAGGRTYVVLARGRPEEMEPVVRYVRANVQ